MHLIASHHSLWGEHLWNASIVLADIYDEPEFVLEGKHVMELGAGAGLPGLICALNGAARVVITDYGTEVNASLVEVIQQNSKCPFLKGNYLNRLMCASPFSLVESLRDHYPQGVQVEAKPYIWGHDMQPLIESSVSAPSDECEDQGPKCQIEKGRLFDIIVIADCLFNRSEHKKLLKTCQDALARDGTAWISFSHHDPEKAELDMNFFKLAVEEPFNFKVTKIKELQMVDLFVCNDGMDEARGVVYLYHLQHGT